MEKKLSWLSISSNHDNDDDGNCDNTIQLFTLDGPRFTPLFSLANEITTITSPENIISLDSNNIIVLLLSHLRSGNSFILILTKACHDYVKHSGLNSVFRQPCILHYS